MVEELHGFITGNLVSLALVVAVHAPKIRPVGLIGGLHTHQIDRCAA